MNGARKADRSEVGHGYASSSRVLLCVIIEISGHKTLDLHTLTRCGTKDAPLTTRASCHTRSVNLPEGDVEMTSGTEHLLTSSKAMKNIRRKLSLKHERATHAKARFLWAHKREPFRNRIIKTLATLSTVT